MESRRFLLFQRLLDVFSVVRLVDEEGDEKVWEERVPVLESTRHSASTRAAICAEDYLICYVLLTNRKHLAVERDG